jgi:SAM-dependent methyltransferase
MTALSVSLNSHPNRTVQVLPNQAVKNAAIAEPTGRQFYEQTRDFYNRLAQTYDLLYPDHLRYSAKLFRSLLPILSASKVQYVLDAACGVGNDLRCLAESGFKIHGADASQEMISEAKRRLAGFSACDPTLFEMDVRQLPGNTPRATYDFVMFRGNTLSNIEPHEFSTVISNLISLARPGGYLLLDYRDGSRQIAEAKTFEYRGCGYNEAHQAAYYSVYRLTHGNSINETYGVEAVIRSLTKSTRYSLCKFAIRSHYVDGALVADALRNQPVETISPPNIAAGGLPYLTTIFLKRKE